MFLQSSLVSVKYKEGREAQESNVGSPCMQQFFFLKWNEILKNVIKKKIDTFMGFVPLHEIGFFTIWICGVLTEQSNLLLLTLDSYPDKL